jgi:hypothetical protein
MCSTGHTTVQCTWQNPLTSGMLARLCSNPNQTGRVAVLGNCDLSPTVKSRHLLHVLYPNNRRCLQVHSSQLTAHRFSSGHTGRAALKRAHRSTSPVFADAVSTPLAQRKERGAQTASHETSHTLHRATCSAMNESIYAKYPGSATVSL